MSQQQDPWLASGITTDHVRELAAAAQNMMTGVTGADGQMSETDNVLNQIFQALSLCAHRVDFLHGNLKHVPILNTTAFINEEGVPEMYGIDPVGRMWQYVFGDDGTHWKGQVQGWVPAACGRGDPGEAVKDTKHESAE